MTARRLRYRVERVRLPDGTTHDVQALREKEFNLRLGLDVVGMARNGELHVTVVFSQNQDLAVIAREIRDILRTRGAGRRSSRRSRTDNG